MFQFQLAFISLKVKVSRFKTYDLTFSVRICWITSFQCNRKYTSTAVSI
jgi:hypothetical protein